MSDLLRVVACVAALACGGCVSMPGGFYDSAPLDDPAVGGCGWTGRYASPVVYTESDHIRGYFEPTNLAAYPNLTPRRLRRHSHPTGAPAAAT